LDHALVLAPETAEAWYQRGKALAHLERHADALASVEQSLRLAPRNCRALTFQANMLIQLQRPAEALES
jgi:cytochrome c-type biogenesis protein CcmH/NrfG